MKIEIFGIRFSIESVCLSEKKIIRFMKKVDYGNAVNTIRAVREHFRGCKDDDCLLGLASLVGIYKKHIRSW